MWSYALCSPFSLFRHLNFFSLLFFLSYSVASFHSYFPSIFFFTLPYRLQSTPAAPPPSVSAVVASFSQFAFWNHLLEFLLVLLFSSATFILHLTFFFSTPSLSYFLHFEAFTHFCLVLCFGIFCQFFALWKQQNTETCFLPSLLFSLPVCFHYSHSPAPPPTASFLGRDLIDHFE